MVRRPCLFAGAAFGASATTSTTSAGTIMELSTTLVPVAIVLAPLITAGTVVAFPEGSPTAIDVVPVAAGTSTGLAQSATPTCEVATSAI